jgi:hypothetical protein
MQGLKKILVSLQREGASCLQKLEMGCGNKGKGIQLDQGKVENGLKDGEHKEDGPGLIQSKDNINGQTQAHMEATHYRILLQEVRL